MNTFGKSYEQIMKHNWKLYEHHMKTIIWKPLKRHMKNILNPLEAHMKTIGKSYAHNWKLI